MAPTTATATSNGHLSRSLPAATTTSSSTDPNLGGRVMRFFGVKSGNEPLLDEDVESLLPTPRGSRCVEVWGGVGAEGIWVWGCTNRLANCIPPHPPHQTTIEAIGWRATGRRAAPQYF